MPPNPTPEAAIRLPVRIYTGDGNLVVDADGYLLTGAVIVTAINAQPGHDKLVKWLRIMIAKFEVCALAHGNDKEFVDIATADARAALAAAKETG